MKTNQIICYAIIVLLLGCSPRGSLQSAQNLAKKSNIAYQQAIAEYYKLIHSTTPIISSGPLSVSTPSKPRINLKNKLQRKPPGYMNVLISRGGNLDKLHYELGHLYFTHGEFSNAAEEFKKTTDSQAKKFLAISLYRLGNFTDALELFNQRLIQDDESLYYQGLTCEKLNLYDQALAVYAKVKDEKIKLKAGERINIIEKVVGLKNIKDIAPEISNILSESAGAQEYPQAGALILLSDEKVEITNANTEVSDLHYLVKILNERGKERFSETHIEYDSTYEKVELEYARTIKPDGSVIEVGSRHIRDVSKYLNFPLYSNARVCIISFPEVVEGAALEYKLKIYRNQLINKKDFVLAYPVQASEPIIRADFTLSIPKGKTIYLRNLNQQYNDIQAELKPQTEDKGSLLVYHWSFKNLPQIIPEANMPSEVDINPTVLISSFNNWQEIYNWWWLLARDKIAADKFIKDKVSELIKDLTSDEAKTRAIYNFCAQKIRYVAVEYGQAGYEPHYASDIFRNKYGDCKDQAILLVTMLKEAGFLAYPVLIGTKGYYNLKEDFPAVLFNHCIAAVSLNGKLIFLDPTAETCSFGDLPPGDQGRRVLVCKEDGYAIENIISYQAEHNLIKQNFNLRINPDESISAKKEVSALGVYEQSQRHWLLYTQPELIAEALKELIQDVSIGARLEAHNIENVQDLNKNVKLNYSFKGPEYFTTAGNLRIMPQLTRLDPSLVAKDKRRYPIELDFLDTKDTVFEIALTNDLRVKYLPANINEDAPWFKLILEYRYRDNKIYFRQNIVLKRNFITPEEYLDFKTFFNNLAKRLKQRIILEKKK